MLCLRGRVHLGQVNGLFRGSWSTQTTNTCISLNKLKLDQQMLIVLNQSRIDLSHVLDVPNPDLRSLPFWLYSHNVECVSIKIHPAK